ncbi:UNKNOWN [Stylonychia lemnae]|uniref:Uncharacterized protein n=1 Tax=Stylonychia lemnae TaxID=5949 RepID=A0A078AS05_STYLE|nr:UNKNOWN [Stylonychia lemnae]|eukprot:CDW83982.1 UNKNOWN [Stylonychia lemnae]
MINTISNIICCGLNQDQNTQSYPSLSLMQESTDRSQSKQLQYLLANKKLNPKVSDETDLFIQNISTEDQETSLSQVQNEPLRQRLATNDFYEKYCISQSIDSGQSVLPSLKCLSSKESQKQSPRAMVQQKSYVLQYEIVPFAKREVPTSNVCSNEQSIDFSDRSQVYEFLLNEQRELQLLLNSNEHSTNMLNQSSRNLMSTNDDPVKKFLELSMTPSQFRTPVSKKKSSFVYTQLQKVIKQNKSKKSQISTPQNDRIVKTRQEQIGLATLGYKNLLSGKLYNPNGGTPLIMQQKQKKQKKQSRNEMPESLSVQSTLNSMKNGYSNRNESTNHSSKDFTAIKNKVAVKLFKQ